MTVNNCRLAYHKIKILEVADGFLDGMKIEFDDNLNCLIGGRGTDIGVMGPTGTIRKKVGGK